MIRAFNQPLLASVGLALGLLFPLSCNTDSSQPSDQEGDDAVTTGTVSLPLTSVVNGHVYRLRNAYLQIVGPTYLYLYGGDDDTVLNATLQTGSYYGYLNSWRLERQDDEGVYMPVTASIESNYASFEVFNGTTTTLVYRFQTDGVIVPIGAGSVQIKIGVDEVPAACTPFGNDCPEGCWCPPTSLSALNRQCLWAGSVALGEPCDKPTACVANASCFDMGSGPICAALCPRSQFNTTCASGGECRRVTSEFGVCVREGQQYPPSGVAGAGGYGGQTGTSICGVPGSHCGSAGYRGY